MLDQIQFQTPVGQIRIVAVDGRVTSIHGVRGLVSRPDRFASAQNKAILIKSKNELLDYFAGKRKSFTFPILQDGTSFQKRVWAEMAKIPYGQTRTYSELAQLIGRPRAARAVGSACGKNPHLITVPCHRVVAGAGLGGFAMGLKVKKHLLAIESKSHLR